jgi:hypothetical protein
MVFLSLFRQTLAYYLKFSHDTFQICSISFMLPCIIIDFFLNNQQDPLIIQIYSVIKLYMFRAPTLPIIGSFLLYIWHW